MLRHEKTISPALNGPSGSPRPAARRALADVQAKLSKGCQQLTTTLAKGIRARPVESVLVALVAGLILGRFKVRPVETVLLTSAAGFLVGMTVANGPRCAER